MKNKRKMKSTVLACIALSTMVVFSGCSMINGIKLKLKPEKKVEEKVILDNTSKGEEVKALQKKLYNIGYDVKIDGNYTAQTVEAIKKLQVQNKLGESGNYTNLTEEVLNKAQSTRDYDTIKQADAAIEEGIKKLLGDDYIRVGFIYYDLANNTKIEMNPNRIFSAASTYKVGLVMATQENIRQGKFKLEDTVQYKSSMFQGGTGVLQAQTNTTLTEPVAIGDLIDVTIKHSDNIGASMIASKYEGGHAGARKQISALTGIEIDTKENKISPAIAFNLLKKLYDNKDDELNAHLIELMKQTDFHDRIDKYVPQDITAHKIGDYDTYVHDIGIVFTDKPYIFVMYTNGVPYAAEKIAQVSKLVYENHTKK
jgi:beta-lactamase class A